MARTKTVLVTGSDGLIGRYLTRHYQRLGWSVDQVDLDYPGGALAFFADRTGRYDLIAHCAYRVGGRVVIDGEPMSLATNLQLDAAMFQYAVRTKARAVLYFSSSAAYPVSLQHGFFSHFACEEEDINAHVHRLVESDVNLKRPSLPDAGYGWAKLTGERLAEAASAEGLRIHIFRPFSGYAHDQSLAYPFPSIIKRALEGDYSVWGPPGQTRDWIHLDDVVNAIQTIYENDDRRPVNLCTGVGTEMGELMNIAAGRDVDVEYDLNKPTGVMYRVGDPSRLFEHYHPRISIEEGVNRAIQWASSEA